jgi:radical SAM superfamily enzyme YgiQ (UPF0313 family)
MPLVYLINPSNPLASMSFNRGNYWNRFRLWKPLGLLEIAGLTPSDWEVAVFDENVGPVDYGALAQPDVVGITAFTSQAPRAYEIAGRFRANGVPVVMGGIHATMCLAEARRYVDCVVTGEAESVWAQVLDDVRAGTLRPQYDGGLAEMDQIAPARHDLLPRGYAFGSIQTTRGCPLNCKFCSVTAFNGARYRERPIGEVVQEFASIPESRVLIVDDNLIGRRPHHVERAKELFRALAAAGTGKRWIGQTTINVADDEELLDLAEEAGCIGLFIGFESVTAEGLPELGRKADMLRQRDIPASVERIRQHNILVVGSFIMGLDSDRPGVGRLIAEAASQYGVDNMNVLFLTPLPGTRLWRQLISERRIALDGFPEDWKYYTLNYPVARYKHVTSEVIVQEMIDCNRIFYSVPNVLARMTASLLAGRNPLFSLVSNLSSRRNSALHAEAYRRLWPATAEAGDVAPEGEPNPLLDAWGTAAQRLDQFAAYLKVEMAWLFRQS